MEDRTVRILDILAANNSIKINLLAEFLDVSRVTLSRDLDNLENRGMIRRTHGFVSLDGANDAGRRMAFFYSIKKRIAKTAAATVNDGESIMIESGSCCALFAEELAMSQKNVTIITNSAFIMNYLRQIPNVKVILLGGFYLPDSQVLVGPITKRCGEALFSDKFFLGVDGFISEYGFTGRDHLRAETAAELAASAKNVYVLTEAAKFKRRGMCNLIQFNRIDGVFTDENIPKEAEAVLQKNNVKLYKVSNDEDKIRWCRFPGQPPFLYRE